MGDVRTPAVLFRRWPAAPQHGRDWPDWIVLATGRIVAIPAGVAPCGLKKLGPPAPSPAVQEFDACRRYRAACAGGALVTGLD